MSSTNPKNANSEKIDGAFDVQHSISISAVQKIAMVEWKTFWEKNKKQFLRKGLKTLILAGVHGDEKGNVKENEGKFVKTCKKLVEKLKKDNKEEFQKFELEMEVLDVGECRNGSEIDSKELAKAVKEVEWGCGKVGHPDLIIEAFCWSRNSVLNDVFFRSGIFPSMILDQDRAEVTAFRCLKADEKQREVIERISIQNPKNVILLGPVGSGKTLLAAMALMMKYHKLVEQFGREAAERNVLVVYSIFHNHGYFSNLAEELNKKYLPFSRHYDADKEKFVNHINMVGVGADNILGRSLDLDNPKADMKKIITMLSVKEGLTTSDGTWICTNKFKKILLMMDEVDPTGKTFNGDWSDFIVDDDRIDLIMAFRADIFINTNSEFCLPLDVKDTTLVTTLEMQYRYCPEIRKFLCVFTNLPGIKHLFPFNNVTDVPNDQESLPTGDAPVWIQRTDDISDVQILEGIQKRLMASGENPSVTVIYHSDLERTDAREWCEMHGWGYVSDGNMFGTDDQAVVALDRCYVQAWSRAREKLYIVTTKHKEDSERNVGEKVWSEIFYEIIKKNDKILEVITPKDLDITL